MEDMKDKKLPSSSAVLRQKQKYRAALGLPLLTL